MAIAGVGTTIYLKDGETLIVVPSDQEYIPNENETEIKGVRAIDIRLRPDEAITAEVEIYSHLETMKGVTPVFYVTNPHDGETKEVREIKFKDGTIWRHKS